MSAATNTDAVGDTAPTVAPRRAGGFATVFRHERRLFRAERLDLAVVVLLLLAVGYALVNGSGWVQRQQGVLAAARSEEAARVQEQRERLAGLATGAYVPTSSFTNPASPLWIGNRHAATYAALPPTGLSATAVGQSDLNPPYTLVNADGRDTFALNEEIENPANLLVGHFDLAFFLVYLLPLVVIGLSYNLLSAEREEGTLALAASNPVRLATLLSAKLAWRGLLVVVPVLAFGAVGLLLAGANPLDADTAPRLAGWALLVVAYTAFWLALAAAVNVLGRSSAHNALLLTSAWIVLALVLPTLLSVGVNLATPVPSRNAMVSQLRDAKAEAGKAYEARYALEHEAPGTAPALAVAGVLNAKDFEAAKKRVLVQQSGTEAIAAAMSDYERRLAAQRTVVERLRFLSPAILVQDALNEVAGSGERRYAAFDAQVNAFHAQWQQFFLPRVLANQALTAADYARFPRFAWVEPAPGPLVQRVLLALAGLLIPALLLAAFCRARVARYPVTVARE